MPLVSVPVLLLLLVDQALTILSAVLARSPHHTLACFSLGRAHLLQGAHDHAAICYCRAAVLARRQMGAPGPLARLASDNMVLCGERVSGLRYRLLSRPFPLLPDVTAQQLLHHPELALGAATSSSAPAPAAAAATVRQPGGCRTAAPAATAVRQRRRRHDVAVTATGSGRADCVVCWMEYELAAGVWLSDPPPASPHLWQRVQYLSARPRVVEGQKLALQVTMYDGEQLRVEYDEDAAAVQDLQEMHGRQRHGVGGGEEAGASYSDAPSGSGGGYGGHGSGGELPPGEPLLPAGEPLSDDEAEEGEEGAGWSSGGRSGGGGGGGSGGGSAGGPGGGSGSDGGDGGGAAAAAPTAAGCGLEGVTAAAACDAAGLLLPYHMSMLNDRLRTVAYLRGIAAAVAEAKARRPHEPLLVLDVGAGTGLLSMAAARAGADLVVGCERELALAVAAGALATANGMDRDRVRLVQVHSKDLSVAQPPQPPQPLQPPQPPQPPPAAQLPRRAGLVESLAEPDAAFLPSAFRIVAALAHSSRLAARLRTAVAAAMAAAAPRLARALPAAAAEALQPWVPWKAAPTTAIGSKACSGWIGR
ncbi:Protein arginine N-methyltransferase 7 [Tetrabaena socialis]|uniref:type I protein arginine methyltransferase n=1 Tax=Tetrabaena socialis TaxID=47790 RepID=A0A2J7ZZE5_9CHLO|nr:Protein arginine N-methyltransferase 7 [Tetrabaena socialis]|eukprot:PNH05633.1 Protein arginine N-methyltransferase 7 [Tetrabaena socialis]